MDQCNGGFKRRILQVLVEGPQLPDQEHALVDHRAGRQRTNVGVLRALLELAAHHVEPAVEVQAARHAFGASEEALGNVRHAVQGRLAEDFRTDGHVPPSENRQALFLRNDLQHPHGKRPLHGILRQKEHADAVVPGFAHGNAGLFGRFGKETVGNLRQNADTVADFAGGILAGAVFQLFDNM